MQMEIGPDFTSPVNLGNPIEVKINVFYKVLTHESN